MPITIVDENNIEETEPIIKVRKLNKQSLQSKKKYHQNQKAFHTAEIDKINLDLAKF